MKHTSEIVTAFVILLSIVVIDGENDTIVLVAPVLSPTSHVSDKVSETAKDFPLLMVLAGDANDTPDEVPKIEGELQPIYVKKLEEQVRSYPKRHKRFKKLNGTISKPLI